MRLRDYANCLAGMCMLVCACTCLYACMYFAIWLRTRVYGMSTYQDIDMHICHDVFIWLPLCVSGVVTWHVRVCVQLYVCVCAFDCVT